LKLYQELCSGERTKANIASGLESRSPSCYKSGMSKTTEQWLLYKYVGLEFTPLSKPFKTREQAEKAREKYPERLRKRIGVGAESEHGKATAADFCTLPAIRLKVQMEAGRNCVCGSAGHNPHTRRTAALSLPIVRSI
jgi:hypothetical protein